MIQHRLAHGQAVLAQPGFADELCGVGEHRHRSVVGCHAAEFTTRHQHSARAQLRGEEGGEDAKPIGLIFIAMSRRGEGFESPNHRR